MAGFTTRIELHAAKAEDYEKLHEAMEAEGLPSGSIRRSVISSVDSLAVSRWADGLRQPTCGTNGADTASLAVKRSTTKLSVVSAVSMVIWRVCWPSRPDSADRADCGKYIGVGQWLYRGISSTSASSDPS